MKQTRNPKRVHKETYKKIITALFRAADKDKAASELRKLLESVSDEYEKEQIKRIAKALKVDLGGVD